MNITSPFIHRAIGTSLVLLGGLVLDIVACIPKQTPG